VAIGALPDDIAVLRILVTNGHKWAQSEAITAGNIRIGGEDRFRVVYAADFLSRKRTDLAQIALTPGDTGGDIGIAPGNGEKGTAVEADPFPIEPAVPGVDIIADTAGQAELMPADRI